MIENPFHKFDSCGIIVIRRKDMMETQSEKDIAINASKLSKLYNNAPQESEDYAVEAQVLDTQVKSVGVNNIAVVAPYGAGKSSAIATYLKRYRKEGFRQPKHIQISLADFNAEDGKPVVQPSADKENAIEQSVLQQLLYSQKKHKLPNSDIHRTNKSRPLVICWYTALAVLFLLDLSQTPIILVSQVIRGYFAKMITQFYPGVYVLSFNEITSAVQIQAIGNITLETPARTERRAVGT